MAKSELGETKDALEACKLELAKSVEDSTQRETSQSKNEERLISLSNELDAEKALLFAFPVTGDMPLLFLKIEIGALLSPKGVAGG